MNASITRRLIAVAVALVMLMGLATTASAHEHREVGDYEFSVGFHNEPAYLNQPNGIYLSVNRVGEDAAEHDEGEESSSDGHGGAGVEGLHETLQAEITIGGESTTLELRPIFGETGSYTADVVPTMEGAYTFRFFGTIEGLEVDESFTAGPNTFSEVESIDSIAFPASTSGDAGSENSAANSAISDAQDSADSARTLAIIGIVAGVLGLAVGAAGVMMAMNARSARTGSGAAARQAGD